MDAREANILLTEVALLDPRFGYVDEMTQVNRAEKWAAALADVALDDARAAVVAHYRETRDRLMPADVVARCPSVSVDRAAVRARAEWLAARGVTEQQLAVMPRHEVERLVRGGEIGAQR